MTKSDEQQLSTQPPPQALFVSTFLSGKSLGYTIHDAVSQSGVHSILSLADGSLVLTDTYQQTVKRLSADRQHVHVFHPRTPYLHPRGLSEYDGSIVVCDSGHHRVRLLSATSGEDTLFAGCGRKGFVDGPVADARLNCPTSVGYDPRSRYIYYVCDKNNHAIRVISVRDQTVTTLAGCGLPGPARSSVSAQRAQFRYPSSLVVDPSGCIYVSDTKNHCIRRITADGQQVEIVAGGQAFSQSGGMSSALLGQGSGPGSVGVGHGGGPVVGGYVDGPASEAQFSSPEGLCLYPDGSLLVADRDNHVIRRISPDRRWVTTFAGGGGIGNRNHLRSALLGGGRLEGAAMDAAFRYPSALCLDVRDPWRVFLTDTGNKSVRVIAARDTFADPGGFSSSGGGTHAATDSLQGQSRWDEESDSGDEELSSDGNGGGEHHNGRGRRRGGRRNRGGADTEYDESGSFSDNDYGDDFDGDESDDDDSPAAVARSMIRQETRLRQIFHYYCSFGEPVMIHDSMSAWNFHRFLRETKLFVPNCFTHVDADVLFSDLTAPSSGAGFGASGFHGSSNNSAAFRISSASFGASMSGPGSALSASALSASLSSAASSQGGIGGDLNASSIGGMDFVTSGTSSGGVIGFGRSGGAEDRRIRWPEFLAALQEIAARRFRFRPDRFEDEHDAFRELLFRHVLKFGKRRIAAQAGSDLLDPDVVNLFAENDTILRRIYDHYSFRHPVAFSPLRHQAVSWEQTQLHNRSLSFDELVTLCREFEVFPQMMNKVRLAEIFRTIKNDTLRPVGNGLGSSGSSGNLLNLSASSASSASFSVQSGGVNAGSSSDTLSYNQFLECIGRIALSHYSSGVYKRLKLKARVKVEMLFFHMGETRARLVFVQGPTALFVGLEGVRILYGNSRNQRFYNFEKSLNLSPDVSYYHSGQSAEEPSGSRRHTHRLQPQGFGGTKSGSNRSASSAAATRTHPATGTVVQYFAGPTPAGIAGAADSNPVRDGNMFRSSSPLHFLNELPGDRDRRRSTSPSVSSTAAVIGGGPSSSASSASFSTSPLPPFSKTMASPAVMHIAESRLGGRRSSISMSPPDALRFRSTTPTSPVFADGSAPSSIGRSSSPVPHQMASLSSLSSSSSSSLSLAALQKNLNDLSGISGPSNGQHGHHHGQHGSPHAAHAHTGQHDDSGSVGSGASSSFRSSSRRSISSRLLSLDLLVQRCPIPIVNLHNVPETIDDARFDAWRSEITKRLQQRSAVAAVRRRPTLSGSGTGVLNDYSGSDHSSGKAVTGVIVNWLTAVRVSLFSFDVSERSWKYSCAGCVFIALVQSTTAGPQPYRSPSLSSTSSSSSPPRSSNAADSLPSAPITSRVVFVVPYLSDEPIFEGDFFGSPLVRDVQNTLWYWPGTPAATSGGGPSNSTQPQQLASDTQFHSVSASLSSGGSNVNGSGSVFRGFTFLSTNDEAVLFRDMWLNRRAADGFSSPSGGQGSNGSYATSPVHGFSGANGRVASPQSLSSSPQSSGRSGLSPVAVDDDSPSTRLRRNTSLSHQLGSAIRRRNSVAVDPSSAPALQFRSSSAGAVPTMNSSNNLNTNGRVVDFRSPISSARGSQTQDSSSSGDPAHAAKHSAIPSSPFSRESSVESLLKSKPSNSSSSINYESSYFEQDTSSDDTVSSSVVSSPRSVTPTSINAESSLRVSSTASSSHTRGQPHPTSSFSSSSSSSSSSTPSASTVSGAGMPLPASSAVPIANAGHRNNDDALTMSSLQQNNPVLSKSAISNTSSPVIDAVLSEVPVSHALGRFQHQQVYDEVIRAREEEVRRVRMFLPEYERMISDLIRTQLASAIAAAESMVLQDRSDEEVDGVPPITSVLEDLDTKIRLISAVFLSGFAPSMFGMTNNVNGGTGTGSSASNQSSISQSSSTGNLTKLQHNSPVDDNVAFQDFRRDRRLNLLQALLDLHPLICSHISSPTDLYQYFAATLLDDQLYVEITASDVLGQGLLSLNQHFFARSGSSLSVDFSMVDFENRLYQNGRPGGPYKIDTIEIQVGDDRVPGVQWYVNDADSRVHVSFHLEVPVFGSPISVEAGGAGSGTANVSDPSARNDESSRGSSDTGINSSSSGPLLQQSLGSEIVSERARSGRTSPVTLSLDDWILQCPEHVVEFRGILHMSSVNGSGPSTRILLDPFSIAFSVYMTESEWSSQYGNVRRQLLDASNYLHHTVQSLQSRTLRLIVPVQRSIA